MATVTHANPPSNCDLCPASIMLTFYDFKVPGDGRWANACPACFKDYGGSLGTGLGQHYKCLAPDVRTFTKVAG